MKHRIALIPLLLLAGACAGQQGAAPAAAHPAGLTACQDPRPEICTREYRPVCGSHADGSRLTYGNGCSACADERVTGWQPGECD